MAPTGLIESLAGACSLNDVLTALDSARRSQLVLTDEQTRLLDGMHVLIEDAVRHRGPRTRRATSSPRAVRRRVSGSAEVDDLVPEYEAYEDSHYSAPGPEDLAEGAAATNESPLRRLVTLKIELTVPESSLSPGQLHWRAKYRSRAIATSAQGLLLSSDRLQLVDLAAAERSASQLLNGSWRPEKAVMQGALVTAASILSGGSPDQLKELRVVAALADVPEQITQPYLVVTIDPTLVVPGPRLAKAFVPPAESAALYRQVKQRLVLPIPAQLAWCRLLLDFTGQCVGNAPFADPHWANYAERFVRAANQRNGSRLTVARISQFLTRQVVALSGDWADAALLTGNGDANARLYYYTPTHAHLRERYEDVWSGVSKGLGVVNATLTPEMAGASKQSTSSFPAEPSPPYIGSRGCPTDEGVSAMVAGLIEHCRGFLRGRRSPDRRRLVHNAIAAYTCVMVLWHAGMRAVTDPVELSLYDPSTGTLGVSDKDNDAYYASRVVWLPNLVQRQIAEYWRHLKALRRVTRSLRSSIGKDLFLFDSSGKPVPLRVQSLRSVLPPSYGYRMNAQRHYLRTRLCEFGVPAQTVDAMLGHGAPGQEPYARHSCYSVTRLRREVEPSLNRLSENAGWVLLCGLAD